MLAPPREARKSGDRGQVSWLGGSSHPSAFPGMSPVASVTGAPLSQWRGRAGFTPAFLRVRDGPGSPAIAIRLSGTLEAKGFRVPRRTLVARGAAVKPRATATERGGLDGLEAGGGRGAGGHGAGDTEEVVDGVGHHGHVRL